MQAFFIGHIVLDQIQTADQHTEGLGGTVTYGSVTASKLGYKSYIISWVGKDFPQKYFDLFKKYGVNINNVKISKEHNTTRFKLIYYNNERKLKLLSKCKDITYEDVQIRDAIYFIGPVIGEVSLNLLKQIYQETGIVVADIQGFIRETDHNGIVFLSKKKNIEEIFSYTHILHIEINEAKAITGKESLIDIIKFLQDKTKNITLLTMGERGSYVIWNKKIIFVPPFQTNKVIDPTGTGDVYTTTFALEYIKTNNIFRAASVSTASASFIVEDIGIKGIKGYKEYITRADKIIQNIKEIDI